MSPDAGGGPRALALMDQVLAQRPDKDDGALAQCARELCIYRDALIERQRFALGDPQARGRLSEANAVLAVVLSVQFPIDAVPWDELDKARGWLSRLTAGEAATTG